MNKTLLYIHGQDGNAEEAQRYEALCPGYRVLGLDYQGQTPWDTKPEILAAYEALRAQGQQVSLLCNSIGAYFAMNALGGRDLAQALFISPTVDMERLILDMLGWAGATEAQLQQQGEIVTDFGQTLSWDYLSYVREQPLRWTAPTAILYAGGDNMTSRQTVERFAAKHGASLTVMEAGEHWFHTAEQLAFLDCWLEKTLY